MTVFLWLSATIFLAAEPLPTGVLASPIEVYFVDGSYMTVQSYEVREKLVLLLTPEGKLHSVLRSLVDMVATELGQQAILGESVSGGTFVTKDIPLSEQVRSGKTQLATEEGQELFPSHLTDELIDDPHTPTAPEVMNRNEEGLDSRSEVIIRAVRVAEAPLLDGILDESLWQQAPIFDSFVQQVPEAGAPATERTEVRIVFTDDSLYFGVVAHQSEPGTIIANELRHDYGRTHVRNDTFSIILDTFHDHRNGYLFYFTPLGAKADYACVDEGRSWNRDWDPIWDVATKLAPDGWTAEVKIPFKSLRYQTGGGTWGINLRRIVLHKNEWTYATAISPAWATKGIGNLSSAAALEGLSGISKGRNLEITPYVLAEATADVGSKVQGKKEFQPGIDIKYGFTPNMNLDLTVNTDFSHVEVDEQQINLTRFSLFFREKRAFFQEGRGIFDFGATRGQYRVLPFFSRRIGLEAGHPVPMRGGGRLTGKMGPYSLGLLSVHTGENSQSPATTFSVARLKRNIFSRSSVGMLWTDRRSGSAVPSNGVLGFDANFNFLTKSQLDLFWVKSTAVTGANSSSHRTRLLLENDLLTLETDWMRVGESFNPGAGFVQRRNMDRRFIMGQVSPRPDRLGIRKIFFRSSLDYVLNLRGHLETRVHASEVELELDQADVITVGFERSYEALDNSFVVAGRLPIASGTYRFHHWSLDVLLSQSRDISGKLRLQVGEFFGGHRRDFGTTGVVKLNKHFFFDVNYLTSDIRLASGQLRTHLVGIRSNVALSTRLFGEALVQWNNITREVGVNARIRYTYHPGSDLYIVFNERTAQPDHYWLLEERSFIVKWTYLFRS